MMKKHTKLATLLGLAVVLATSTASAVPDTMTFSGRLSTSSGPVTGSVNLVFRIFPDASGGTHIWTETRNGVGADSGLVYVELGQLTPLDEVVFDDATVFLEIQVGSETLSPRIAINSVPYAIRAGSAASADEVGGIDPGDIVTSVTAGPGIQANAAGNGVVVGLSTTGCATGEVWKYDGAAWNCVADADTTYTAGTGINIAGGAISLSTSGCVSGEVWKYNGAAFSCEPDAGTTYTGTAPISVAGTAISLSTTGCVAGDVWKYNGSGWSCDPDDTGTVVEVDGVIGNEITNVTNATLTRAGSGTSVSPYTVSLNLGNANTWTAAQTFSAGVTATTFTYSSPVTGQVIGSPVYCHRGLGSSSDPHLNTGVSNPPANGLGPSILAAGGVAGGTYEWWCEVPLTVPPGATVNVTGATLYYHDGSATCRVAAELRIKTFGQVGFGAVIGAVTNGADANDFAHTVSLGGTKAFPAFAAANLGSNQHLFVEATIENNANGTGDCRYSGVLVNYTVNRP